MVMDGGFEDWYRREHGALVASMLVVCGSTADAADIADEAFSRALERWSQVSVMSSPTGWTYRVAVNLARRRWRRRAIEQRVLRLHLPAPVITGPAGEAWLLVADLPLRQRTAVVLRHIGQLTEVEIAEAMGVGRSTVSSTLRTAHRALALALEPPPGADHV